METGGDVGAYIRKYGVVSEKATTGLLKKKKADLIAKCKKKKKEINLIQINSKY